MKSSVSNLRVRVLNVLKNCGNHRSDLLDIINVLSYLGEGHDTSMLVSPVCVVGHGVLHKNSNQRQHHGLTNTSNESVNSLLSEADIVFLLVFASEALLGAKPVVVDILIDVDHELEDEFEHVLDQSLVLLGERGLPFDHGNHKLERLMTDCIVCKILVRDNWLESFVKGFKVSAEEVGLDFGKLVELDEGVFKNSLVLLGKGLGNNTSHEGQKLNEFLSVLALSDGKVIRKGLKGCNLNVQFSHTKCPLEDSSKLILVLYQVVKNVAEKTIEDKKSSVNLCLVVSLDEGEEEVEQVLPDGVVLFINHGALNFDGNIANLVNQSLV